MTDIAVLMTCHNRRENTLGCLRALFGADLPSGFRLRVFLVDDGSTDGTTEAITQAFPKVTVLPGDGSLYWNRGMHRAFGRALEIGFDGYLWLNDDTILRPGAIYMLSETARAVGDDAVVVGATCDDLSGAHTYGGGRRRSPRLRPFFYDQITPNGEIQHVDVANGNVVLITAGAAFKVGNIDPVFQHGMGDIDYGLRAQLRGVPLVLTANYVGTCSRNAVTGTYQDNCLDLRERLKHAFSRKGLPVQSWFHMCFRHGGVLWPLHFVWGYIRIAAGRG